MESRMTSISRKVAFKTETSILFQYFDQRQKETNHGNGKYSWKKPLRWYSIEF